jgi:hypothetical protein
MRTDDKNRQTEREKAMKTDITNTVPDRHSVRKPLASMLLAATALLLQGCTTARPAWTDKADANPLSRSAFERMEPREGIALVNFNF